MPVVPNFIERLILLKLNLGPGPMLEMLGALSFKAVSVAIKLGVFKALSKGPMAIQEIARQTNTDERGITLLLEALEATGYLKKQNDQYKKTPMATKWLTPGSETYIGDAVNYFNGVIERWDYLDKAICQGETPMLTWEWLDQRPGSWDDYQSAMLASSRMAGDEIVAKVKLPASARRLLDVGGGHGLNSVKFCKRYSKLTAIVFDWPQALETAKKIINVENIEDRVSIQEGDFLTDTLGDNFDVALVFNIIHMYTPEKNVELLQKVANSLNSGGLVVILDQMAIKSSGPTAKATAKLIGLDLFVEVNGQSYAPDNVIQWLKATGFTHIRKVFLRKSPGFALVVGKKA